MHGRSVLPGSVQTQGKIGRVPWPVRPSTTDRWQSFCVEAYTSFTMSATINRDLTNFITLFRDTWAECVAFHAKQRIEAAGHTANWHECLATAQTQADELFEPVLSGLRKNAPIPRLLAPFLERVKAARAATQIRDTIPSDAMAPS